ncbi:MAG TPA: hypothetical protein VFJ82_19935 [Longimicrobium sp.]|nr:hypothetical protein [Longimicrobium sp.]
MEREGPVLETLTRRLAETPEDFLAEPRIGEAGRVHTAAVVGDLLRDLGGSVESLDLARFRGANASRDRNRLSLALVLCWLLADDWFRRAAPPSPALLELLGDQAAELAEQSAAGKFVTDPDRREELARLALARLGYRPAGETRAQAQDRLTTLSSAERARVLRAAREAEQRAREIREALIRKAAEEAADKWGRE